MSEEKRADFLVVCDKCCGVRLQVPEVVLIKDEDSDGHDSTEDGERDNPGLTLTLMRDSASRWPV